MDLRENILYKYKVRGGAVWIDFCKLLGIYLMLLGHSGISKWKWLEISIIAFHMPLFFFLSGLTSSVRDIKKEFFNGLRYILVPYFIFYVITYIWWFAVVFLRQKNDSASFLIDGIAKPLLGCVIGTSQKTEWSIHTGTGLWFLPALFWTKIIESFAYTVKKEKTFVVEIPVIAVCVAFSYLLYVTDTFTPFWIGNGCMAYPFYVAGKYSKNYLKNNEGNFFLKWGIFILCIFVFIFSLPKTEGISIAYIWFSFTRKSYNFSVVLWAYIGALAAVYCTVQLCRFVQKIPVFFLFLAQNTITILAFNGILIALFAVCMNHIFHTSFYDLGIILKILCVFLILCISAFPCFCMESLFPKLLHKRK